MRLLRGKNLLVVLFGLALGCVPFNVGPALAHNTLDSSAPVDGDVLNEPPTIWTLRFDKSVPLDSASGQVIDQGGIRTALSPPIHGESDNVIVFSLPTGLVGPVTARWRLVGVDGHIISGRVSFEVVTATQVPIVNPPSAVESSTQASTPDFADPTPPLPRSVSYAIRYLDLLFLFGILGLIIVELGIAQGVVATARGATFARIGGTGLIITGFIQALSFTAELTESSLVNALGGITTALGTTPGAMFYMQPLLATLLIALFRKGSWTSHRTDATLVISTLGMFLIARAYTGHPRSEGWALLGIPLDIVHTSAAAAWLGGLVILLTCVVSAVATQDGVRAFQAFGRMADFAVPAILVTGFIQTLNMHGGIGTIMSTTHGRVLFAKLTLVTVMLAVGFVNRRRVRLMRPIQNGSPTTLGRLIRASVVETGIGVAGVAVTAVLVSTSLN